MEETNNINIILSELEKLNQELLFIGQDRNDERVVKILLKIEVLEDKLNKLSK